MTVADGAALTALLTGLIILFGMIWRGTRAAVRNLDRVEQAVKKVEKSLNGHPTNESLGKMSYDTRQLISDHIAEDQRFADEMRREWAYQHGRNHLIANLAAKGLSRTQLAAFAKAHPTDPLVAEIIAVLGADGL